MVNIRITMTATGVFESREAMPLRGRSKYFKPPKLYRALNSDLSIADRYAILPFVQGAGNQFTSGFDSLSGDIKGSTGLFQVGHSGRPGLVGSRIHAYGDKIVVPSLTLVRSLNVDGEGDPLGAISQELDVFYRWANPRLDVVARMAMGVAREAKLTHLRFPRRHTMIEIAWGENDSATEQARMAKFISENRRRIISTHIALSSENIADPRLERDLIGTNGELNMKSEHQFLAVNAQGSLTVGSLTAGSGGVSSTDGPRDPYVNRFVHVKHLSEIAMLLQHVGLTVAGESEIRSQDWAADEAVAWRWVRYPQNALYRSVGNLKIWEVLSDSFRLTSIFDELEESFGASAGSLGAGRWG